MAVEPVELRRRVLEQVVERGIVPDGEELVAAATGRLLALPEVLDGPEALDPDHLQYGFLIAERGHPEGTYVVAASDRNVWDFLTRHHHLHAELDDRPGAWTCTPLAERMGAWYPLDGHAHGAGVLELGDRRFLIARGEGDGAAAIAAAVQAARA